jgi:hypothetical protein
LYGCFLAYSNFSKLFLQTNSKFIFTLSDIATVTALLLGTNFHINHLSNTVEKDPIQSTSKEESFVLKVSIQGLLDLHFWAYGGNVV